MSSPVLKVFEDAKSMNNFDVVCPSCENILIQQYSGSTGRLNRRCDNCNTFLYEYSAVAVEHGKENSVNQRDLERTLRDYWDLEIHGETRKKDFERAAEKIGIYDYL